MLEGLWSDGRSSRVRRVQVRRAALDALDLTFDDGELQSWPLDQVRIDPRLGSAPRILRRDGHGQVECPDSPLLEAWFPRGGGWVEWAVDFLERRRTAIVTAAAGTAALTLALFHWGVPWGAKAAAEHMPAAVERQVSDQTLALLERMDLQESRLSQGQQQALREKFIAMVSAEPRATQMRLHFARAPRIGPNAFALPDGRIYITDALVELAADDEERLAVLAHEAGHHVHHHGMQAALQQMGVVVLVGAMLGDVSGSSLAVGLPAALLSSRFARDLESEADAYAFDLLRRQGHSPEAFARVMERMDKHSGSRGENAGVAGYLSSHPPSPSRIRAAREAARGQ